MAYELSTHTSCGLKVSLKLVQVKPKLCISPKAKFPMLLCTQQMSLYVSTGGIACE